MESIIRNVKDIEDADRRSLEHVVGQQLQENQQVIIRVVDISIELDEQTRRTSLEEAADIARQGRDNAAAQGVTEDEVDAALDEAIQHVRKQNE